MILDAVHLCYDPSHHPFASEGAVRIEDLDSERPASKIIRAVIRYNGLDTTSWETYSLHKCYCNSKGKQAQEVDDLMDPRLTLEELGIKGGDCLFIRQAEIEDQSEAQYLPIPSSSGKRKRTYHEDELLSSTSAAASRSSSRGSADQVSNLKNLNSQAVIAARIGLLDGDGWKTQSTGRLGMIQTRSQQSLKALQGAVKTSLKIPQAAKVEAGLFNSDLVEALTRAYHQRLINPKRHRGGHFLHGLLASDYERANELLKGKIEGNGYWERSEIAHLDESAVSNPVSRFPLSDSGLSGHELNAARAVCALWNNDKWINQAPFTGLSPISLKRTHLNAVLRQIAQLTRVKPGEATPDGFPPIVLNALRQAIQQRTEKSGSTTQGSRYGWKQSKDIAQALEILKRDLEDEELARSTSSASTSVNERLNKKVKESFN